MLRRSACLAVAGLALLAAPASGAELLSTGVSTPAAAKRTCHAKLLTGGAGYVQRQVTAPATGVISARLNGAAGGDWDLGVFDAKGRTVAGSAHFGNVELAEGIATKGQRLTVQACRRSGPVQTVQLRVAGWALPVATGDNRVQLVRVSTPTRAAKNRLLATGLDLTEHGSATYLDVVLHGADDVQTLTSRGFSYRVVIPDLVRHDRAALRMSRSAGPRPAMPSGRKDYRRLPDYSADMKRLAEARPGIVRPITLPYLSLEGRPIEGIEITRNPYARDGKPVFLQMGLHHAREWPSGEHAIEWAYELVNKYGVDQRVTDLVNGTRTIVVPVVNPDGFNLTREVPFANEALDPLAGTVPIDSGQPVVDPGFAYKRRNCRMVQLNASESGYEARPGACSETSNRTYGVDPNRNYGGFWGGPGASPDPTSDTFWGQRPFSEPETKERAVAGLPPPGDHPDHQPHLLGPDPPPAGRCGARRRHRRGAVPGARRRDGGAERLLELEGLPALRHHRHHRGLDLLRHRRVRVHVRDRTRGAERDQRHRHRRAQLRPGDRHRRLLRGRRVPSPVPARGRLRVERQGGARRQGQSRGLLRRARIDARRHQALGDQGPGGARVPC